MFTVSRKELNEALKWCQKRSPLGTLVFAMNGKWGVPGQNEENIIVHFLRYWKAAKGAILLQGKKRLEDISIPVPDFPRVPAVKNELISLLISMPERFRNTERYALMESYCRDMKNLFVWDKLMEDLWIGYILMALDCQGKTDECEREFAGHEDSEAAVSLYAKSLLKRCEVRRASEILEPFRGSTDEDILKCLDLLDKLHAVKTIR